MQCERWDERLVLPFSAASNTLEKMEQRVKIKSMTLKGSPSCARRQLLNNRELRETVRVVPGFWRSGLCDDILTQLHEGMRTLGKDWYTNRHSAYSTVDFPLHEATRLLDQNVRRQLRNRLLATLAKTNGFAAADDLFFKDLFFVKYSTRTSEGEAEREKEKEEEEDSNTEQAGLGLHRDGSVLSFNILLNPSNEFSGGGTYFQHSDKVVEINQGDCVVHSGTVLHAGRNITRGKRYLLVGFVEASTSPVPFFMRSLFVPTLVQVALLEAEATAKRESENATRDGVQLDVEEDVLRMLCLD